MKKFNINGTELDVSNIKQTNSHITFTMNGAEYEFSKNSSGVCVDHSLNKKQVFVDGVEAMVEVVPKLKSRQSAGGAEGSIQSPMPGKIFKVIKKEGDQLEKGDTILIMEAMKMEHAIKAPKDGVLKKILYKEGDQVQGQVDLVEIDNG